MAERFFVAHLDPAGSIRLTGEQAHHLTNVCRIGRGDRVFLFDGSGAQWEAVVERDGKREVVLSVVARQFVDRELPFRLTLACAPPKGERLRWLVEKATELGVTRFLPLQTERTSVHVRGVKPEKMRRWVIEASKQCGRNVLMELSDPMPWPKLVDWVSPALLRILAHPAQEAVGCTNLSFGRSDAPTESNASSRPELRFVHSTPVFEPTQSELQQGLDNGVVIAIGPEGGFTDAEVGLARQHGWGFADLGSRTLRVETAALTMVAWVTLRFLPAHHASSIPSPTS